MVLLPLAYTPPLSAAKLVPPASAALRGEHNHIMEATVLAVPEPNRVKLRCKRKLHGSPPAEVTVRLEPATVAKLQVGERVLIAFSDWRKVRFPGLSNTDPEGFQALRVPGIGQAIFAPSKPARQLLVRSGELDPEALLDLLIRGLSSSDPNTQRLFVADLMPRTELHTALGKAQTEALAKFGSDPRSDPEAREYLLLTAQRPPHSLGQDWWRRTSRQLAASAELDLDPISAWPNLLRTSLLALRQQPESDDFELAARWLHSPHGGLVRTALEVLGTLDRDRLAPTIDRALESAGLPAASRKVLNQHRALLGAPSS